MEHLVGSPPVGWGSGVMQVIQQTCHGYSFAMEIIPHFWGLWDVTTGRSLCLCVRLDVVSLTSTHSMGAEVLNQEWPLSYSLVPTGGRPQAGYRGIHQGQA